MGGLRTLHSLSGVVALGGFLVFHAWQQWAVRVGRNPLLARMDATANIALEVLLVFVPLLVHGCAGWLLRRRPDAVAERAYRSPAFRRFQAITGGIGALFLAVHVFGVWLPRARSGRAEHAYGALMDHTGTLLGAGLYVVGVSALCAHFGQGLGVAMLRFVPGLAPGLARAFGGLVGLSLWLVLFNELAAYATGAPLM